MRRAEQRAVRESGGNRIVPGPLRDAAAHVRALDALLEEGLARLGERLAGRRNL